MLRDVYNQVDRKILGFAERQGTNIVRVTLSVVFVWFGMLKLLGQSPVAYLAAGTLPGVKPEVIVFVYGVLETLIGLALFFKAFLRVTLAAFWIHMLSTFALFVLRPDITMVGGNPLLLTVEGEFVVKNLVFIASGVAVASTVKTRNATAKKPA